MRHSRHEQRETGRFRVCRQPLFRLCRVVEIGVAELIQFQVGHLPVDVAGYRLETTEQQRAAHHVQVAAQRIANFHFLRRGKGRPLGVILAFGQRVAHHFVKAVGREVAGNVVLQLFLVGMPTCVYRYLNSAGYFHVVVSVNPQYLFHHIGLADYIYAVGGRRHHKSAGLLVNNDEVQRR